jgi:hypothetical protein
LLIILLFSFIFASQWKPHIWIWVCLLFFPSLLATENLQNHLFKFCFNKKFVIYRQKNKKAGALTHQVMMIHETLAAAHSHRYLHACMQLGCGRRASCHCISSISINNG